ncbi:MAG: signal peptidase I [Clostridia bacterium]|nr:signal peptidase I [Clostridia bacterium]
MNNYDIYKNKEYKLLSGLANSCFVFVCMFLLLFTGLMFYCNNFLTLYPVSQISMMPYINPNGIDEDYVYVNSNTNDITYGDVVICEKGPDLVIKRVIAMPGDNLMIKLTDDGYYSFFIQYSAQGEWVKLEEDYVRDKTVYETSYNIFYTKGDKTFEIDEYGNQYLPITENEIFLAGDNRLFSKDCIEYGALDTMGLVGEVVYLIHGQNFKIFQVFTQFLGFIEWK